MRVFFAALLAVAAASLLAPGSTSAHPLGNFTVNRHAGIELAGDRVFIHYVLDLAEIPTFQLGDDVRAKGYPGRLVRDLELTLDGQRVPLRALERRVVTSLGAGGLETLRLDVVYGAKATGTELRFVDRAFASRIGWREVTLSARDGASIGRSSVPAVSASDELHRYPQDLLRSPVDVSSAEAVVDPGDAAGSAPVLAEADAPTHGGGGFEALIERGELSLGVLLVSLLVAMFWGAAHALTPGHGKSMVAAYLVGTRGTPRHALMLGATVTVAHTSGVFAIGIVTLALSQFIVPEQLYPWLTLVSGFLVVAVGAAVLRQRLRQGLRPARTNAGGHHHSDDRHHHGHDDHRHGDDHDHSHDHALTSKGIVGVGIAAGLLPCPSALVVLLSAIALHRIGLGLALIVAFSVGLAATITAIGLVAVFARRAFGRLSLNGPVVRALPVASAVLILAVGIAITVKALPGVL